MKSVIIFFSHPRSDPKLRLIAWWAELKYPSCLISSNGGLGQTNNSGLFESVADKDVSVDGEAKASVQADHCMGGSSCPGTTPPPGAAVPAGPALLLFCPCRRDVSVAMRVSFSRTSCSAERGRRNRRRERQGKKIWVSSCGYKKTSRNL